MVDLMTKTQIKTNQNHDGASQDLGKKILAIGTGARMVT